MKLTDRLVGDHKTFRKMLADLDQLANQPPAERHLPKLIRHVELFKDHMVLHAWCEDTFYYPAIRDGLSRGAVPPLSVAYMDHLDHEHITVDGYLDRLELDVKATPINSMWPQTYALFSKALLTHMRKEEEELFPLSEQMLGAARLEALSKELEHRRSEAPRIRLHTKL